MTWSLAADIATVITSISILIALIQLVREMGKQNIESFFYLHEYLSQEQFSRARKAVRTELYRKAYETWSDLEKEYANLVCSSYDQAGILISTGIVNAHTKKAFLQSSWGRSIMDQYDGLCQFLDNQQTPVQTGREFFRHFTWLYMEAQKYQRGR